MLNWLITKGILPHVVIVLIAAAITGAVGWGITKLKLDNMETKYENQVLQNENDRKAYEKAAAEAKAKAQEVVRKKEQEYAEIKAKQDAAYSKLSNDYRLAIVRYKNSVRTSGPGFAQSPGSSPSVEGAGGDSLVPQADTLVPVPEDDLRICAVNTAKAQIAHDWVMSLDKSN